MRNTFLICLSLFVIIPFSGCLKKGDDDPAISLRSRKARVDGEWKAVSYKKTTIYTNTSNPPVTITNVYTSDGTSYTSVTTGGSNSATQTGVASQTWEFDKEGSYDISEITDGVETKYEGRWNFTSNVGDTKDKSQLALSQESKTTGTQQSTSTGNQIDEVYDIKELRNKKMVLYSQNTTKDANGTVNTEIEIELESTED